MSLHQAMAGLPVNNAVDSRSLRTPHRQHTNNHNTASLFCPHLPRTCCSIDIDRETCAGT